MNESLANILDTFQQNYNHLQVDPTLINVKDAFATTNGYDAPTNYGNLNNNDVLAYIVRGASLIEKYKPSHNTSSLHIRNVKNDWRYKTLACLCVYHLRNTSLRAIDHGLNYTNTLHGYTQHHVETMVQTIQNTHPDFDKTQDSAFIFASKNKAKPRALLNATLFQQILDYGSDMLHKMGPREASLMEHVFPQDVLQGNAIKQYSYMPNRTQLHIPETIPFLKHKTNTYRQVKQ